ncbi:MAG: HEAT repeat domain-containing protein [Phycisphaerae bacterium]|nr:HEAT repeat domain-containing protein [Phycisphaerae bacterium]
MCARFAKNRSHLSHPTRLVTILIALASLAIPAAAQTASPPAAPPASSPIPTRDDELRQLRARLHTELRNGYLRAAEHQRADLIATFLADPLPVARRLGLELVQARLTEGAVVPPAVASAARKLITDCDESVRTAAVIAITALRDPADEPLLISLIHDQAPLATRSAAVNGLGYIGSDAAFAVLLAVTGSSDIGLRGEALNALSRLVERGALRAESLVTLKHRLVAFLQISDPNTRERALFSLGRLNDPMLAPLFERVAESPRGGGERLAAFRSLTQLGDEWSVDCARRLTLAVEPSLRRAAVEVLKRAGHGESDLMLLQRLSTCDGESDDATRTAAWSGALRLAGELGVGSLLSLAESLDEQDADWTGRVLELAAIAAALDPPQDSEMLSRLQELAARAQAMVDSLTPPVPQPPTDRPTSRAATQLGGRAVPRPFAPRWWLPQR